MSDLGHLRRAAEFVASAGFGAALPFVATFLIVGSVADFALAYGEVLPAVFAGSFILGGFAVWLLVRRGREKKRRRLERPRDPRISFANWPPQPPPQEIPYPLALTGVVSGMVTSAAGLVVTIVL